MFNLATEPQGIGKTIDSGFKLFFAAFKGVIILTLIVGILNTIPQFIIPGMAAGMADPTNPTVIDPSTLGITFFVIFFALIVISMIFSAAIISKIGATARGESMSIGSALGRGLKVFIPILIASILYMLAITVGSILLIIPGIILMLSLIFYSYAIVLDKRGIIESLKESHKLVWGNWWRTAIVLTIAFIIVYVLLLGITIPLSILVPIMSPEDPMLALYLFSGVNLIVYALITPLFFALFVVVYEDLKVRKGGADLAARIEATE